MPRVLRHIVAGLLAPLVPATAELVNVDMTWTSSTLYDSFGNYDYPDNPDNGIVNVSAADFEFRDNASSIWRVNDGAAVILKQDGGSNGHRFFVGIADGGSGGTTGTLTITSDSGSPGSLSARGNAYAAMRIGHESDGNSASGVVNIEGGVTVQTGWIFGEGSGTRDLNIVDGEFQVFSGDDYKRLNEIDVTIGFQGALWIEDSTGSVTDLVSFERFVSGATTARSTRSTGRPAIRTPMAHRILTNFSGARILGTTTATTTGCWTASRPIPEPT